MHPKVGGAMRFSRGVAYLNPQGPSPAGQGSAEAGAQEADLVAQAFSALQARKEGPSGSPVRQQSRLEALQQVAPAQQAPHKLTHRLCEFFCHPHVPRLKDLAKLVQPCDKCSFTSAAY